MKIGTSPTSLLVVSFTISKEKVYLTSFCLQLTQLLTRRLVLRSLMKRPFCEVRMFTFCDAWNCWELRVNGIVYQLGFINMSNVTFSVTEPAPLIASALVISNSYSMGIAGYVSVCVQLYCMSVFTVLHTCFGLRGHLQVCRILHIFIFICLRILHRCFFFLSNKQTNNHNKEQA
jgi:hypothetical protein